MSESGDYTPVSWGDNFKSARSSYRDYADRSYGEARASGKTAKDLVPEKLETKSTCPMVIACDVTGSMGEWPATIFSKLPYLDNEARKEYLGEDYQVSFAAVGDASKGDTYPLQARPFDQGQGLKTTLKELIVEGGGGGGGNESYELAALYYARRTSMPNASKPILIFIGDEKPYEEVSPGQAKSYAGVSIKGSLSTEDVFKELRRRFEVYFIQKPYGSESFNAAGGFTREVYQTWAKLVGSDRIAQLPEADRVVDVIFGILANESGRTGYFREEIEERQKPGQVKTVYTALEGITGAGASKTSAKPSGKSQLRKKSWKL